VGLTAATEGKTLDLPECSARRGHVRAIGKARPAGWLGQKPAAQAADLVVRIRTGCPADNRMSSRSFRPPRRFGPVASAGMRAGPRSPNPAARDAKRVPIFISGRACALCRQSEPRLMISVSSVGDCTGSS